MAITLNEALTATQDLLRDYAGLVVSNAVLLNWLDAGQKNVAALTMCYQRLLTLTDTDSPQAIVEGQRLYPYALPIGAGGLGLSDHLHTLHILLGGVPLFLWTPTMIGYADVHTNGGGTPYYYYEFANALTFVPYPNADFLASAFKIELVYGAEPAEWTTGESVLPPAFDELPIYFAAARAAMQRRHWPMAHQWFSHYMTALQGYRVTSLLHYATPQTQRQQPPDVERDDEPRRLHLLAAQRQQARLARR